MNKYHAMEARMAEAGDSLPPFAALRAFRAAARHGRFRDAARDLGVTESAVSHQIKRLEELVRMPLFDRNGPQVSLTADGRRYYAAIDPALLTIAEATRALTGSRERGQVVLTLPPSLAMLWLIPRLPAFETAFPDIDLQLNTTTRVVDLRREQVDLAIRHGQGAWADVKSDFLFSETATPVCRPGYLPAGAVDDPVVALSASRLIVNGYFPDEWTEWARARGIGGPAMANTLKFETQEQVLAAAEQGLGLAIGRSPLVDGRIASGALEAPFGASAFAQAAYYLCRSPAVTPTAAARRVMAWLKGFVRE